MISTFLKNLHRILLHSETLILIVLFLSLTGISVAQIILRNVFASGIIWADSYARISVLWIAMIGAMIASRDDQHISIDILLKKLPHRYRRVAKRVSGLFTAIICFIMAWYSLTFVVQEYEFGGYAFDTVPNWFCEAIIPFAFLIVAARYLIASILKEGLRAE